jgi:hypothetical protein
MRTQHYYFIHDAPFFYCTALVSSFMAGRLQKQEMYSVFRHAAVVLAPIYRWGCIALFPCPGPSRRRSYSEISQRTLSILACSPIMTTLSDSPTQLYVVSKLAGRFCPCVGLTVIPQEHKYPVVCIRIALSLPFLSTYGCW